MPVSNQKKLFLVACILLLQELSPAILVEETNEPKCILVVHYKLISSAYILCSDWRCYHFCAHTDCNATSTFMDYTMSVLCSGI